MSPETLAKLKALDIEFDEGYEVLASAYKKNKDKVEDGKKGKVDLKIKYISSKQDDKQYIVKVAFIAKNCKTDIATISLNVVPKPLSFLEFAMVKNVKFKGDTNTFEFKFDVNPFEPNKFADVDFVATVTIDGLQAVSQFFQIENKKVKDQIKDKLNKEYATEDDWIKAAKELGVNDVDLIKTIAYQESRIVSYLEPGLPKILYERHHFYNFYKNKFGKQLADKLVKDKPLLINPLSGGYGNSAFFRDDKTFDEEAANKYQHEKLNDAIKINEDFAIMSTSFGVFQVLGEYCEYSNQSPKEFLIGINKSEKNQLTVFVNFVKGDNAKKGLPEALTKKNWELVASIYNGKKWKEINPNYAKNLKFYYEMKPWKKE